MSEATQTTDATPEITRTDEFTLDEAIDRITANRDATYCVSKKDGVWAVITCSGTFGETLAAAVEDRDVLVRNADRDDGKVSVALKKFNDYL